jgi:hypothetical protein
MTRTLAAQPPSNQPQPKLVEDPADSEPKVLGESRYDQVTSLLMAVVLGAILVVAWLGLVYVSNQAYASRVTAPMQIVEVSGSGGGSPEGTPGSTEKIDIAGADPAAMASNNEEEAGDFEEPSVQQTPGAMLDAAAEAGEAMAEVDLGVMVSSGGSVASGKRASKLGTGGPGLGSGPGDGFGREQRWSIVFPPDQTIEEYARQLDALHVHLGVVMGSNQLADVSNFTASQPKLTYGTGRGDGRLYFLWQGKGRKDSDITLLKKAGIDVGDRMILQFYPREAEERLALYERRYRGRQPGEIRVTRFSVVPAGSGYDFKVIAQETLR